MGPHTHRLYTHLRSTFTITMSDSKSSEDTGGFFSPHYGEPFFGCLSAGAFGCVMSFICPYIVASSNRANHDGRPVEIIHSLCPANPYQTRQSLRQKYALDYAKFNDCIAAWCCMACMVNQEAREIAARSGKTPKFMGHFE